MIFPTDMGKSIQLIADNLLRTIYCLYKMSFGRIRNHSPGRLDHELLPSLPLDYTDDYELPVLKDLLTPTSTDRERDDI